MFISNPGNERAHQVVARAATTTAEWVAFMAGMLVEIDAVSGAGSEKSIATAAVAGASPMETTNAESALAAKQDS